MKNTMLFATSVAALLCAFALSSCGSTEAETPESTIKTMDDSLSSREALVSKWKGATTRLKVFDPGKDTPSSTTEVAGVADNAALELFDDGYFSLELGSSDFFGKWEKVANGRFVYLKPDNSPNMKLRREGEHLIISSTKNEGMEIYAAILTMSGAVITPEMLKVLESGAVVVEIELHKQ